MNKEEINTMIEKHKLWLENKEGGEIANFECEDLTDADLEGADLRGARFKGANLRGADLRRANLAGACFGGADLNAADLRDADLRNADLGGADLRNADLKSADLRDANLRKADLEHASLTLGGSMGAHFDDAQLRLMAWQLMYTGTRSENVSREMKRGLKKLIDLVNDF